MGYDVYLVSPSDEMLEEKKRRREVWDLAIKARNALPESEQGTFNIETWTTDGGSEEFQRLQGIIDRNDPWGAGDYYRLNIWGMSTMRKVMASVGMLDENVQDVRDWPDHPGDEHFDDEGYPSSPIGRLYRDAIDTIKSKVEEDQTGIARYKLGSNDGWIVTPEEIALALGQLEVNGPPDFERFTDEHNTAEELEGWFDRWTTWLRSAIDHGGFKVW